jgi:hypothetical protein
LDEVRGGPAHDHAEVHGENRPIGEGEINAEIAQDKIVGQASSLQDCVGGGHADRLRGVVLGNAFRADAVRVQALEDHIVGEVRRGAIGVMRVDRRSPRIQNAVENLMLISGHGGARGAHA